VPKNVAATFTRQHLAKNSFTLKNVWKTETAAETEKKKKMTMAAVVVS
jgi:hypothetical protein